MAYQDDIKKVATLLLPWDKLSGCNVLVTGATGLIGGCLVDVLIIMCMRLEEMKREQRIVF